MLALPVHCNSSAPGALTLPHAAPPPPPPHIHPAGALRSTEDDDSRHRAARVEGGTASAGERGV